MFFWGNLVLARITYFHPIQMIPSKSDQKYSKPPLRAFLGQLGRPRLRIKLFMSVELLQRFNSAYHVTFQGRTFF